MSSFFYSAYFCFIGHLLFSTVFSRALYDPYGEVENIGFLEIKEWDRRSSEGKVVMKAQVDASNLDNLSIITKLQVAFSEDGDVVLFYKMNQASRSAIQSSEKSYFYGETSIVSFGVASINLLLRTEEDGTAYLTGSIITKEFVYSISTTRSGNIIASAMHGSSFDDDDDDDEKESRNGGINVGARNEKNAASSKKLYLFHSVRRNNAIANGQMMNDQVLDGDSQVATIDIMVLYTRNAMCAENGRGKRCPKNEANTNAILDLIDLSIEQTNIAFELSGVAAKLRLVHVEYAGNKFDDSELYFSRNLLRALEGGRDGLEKVPMLREQYGADIVSMIVESVETCGATNDGLGISNMYNVVKRECSSSQYSFSHEIGHNFGCYHNRGDSGELSAFAHGYQDPHEEFRTILSYDCKNYYCPRILRFSSSSNNALFRGRPFGDEEHDCARQINSVRHEVAGYFDTKVATQISTTMPTKTPSRHEASVFVETKVPTQTTTTMPTRSPILDKRKRWVLPDFDLRVKYIDIGDTQLRNDYSDEDLTLISSQLSDYFVAFLCVGIAQGNCGVDLNVKLTPAIPGLFGEQKLQMRWNAWIIYSSQSPSIVPVIENKVILLTEECCRDDMKIFYYLNRNGRYKSMEPFSLFMELRDYSNCNEDPGAMFILNPFRETKQTCEWLAKRPNGKKKQLCSNLLDGRAAQVCPETCGFCNNKCSDDLNAIFTMEDGQNRKCGWLSESSWYQRKLCEGPTFAKKVCPDTCKGMCRDTQKYSFASCRANPCTDDPDWIFKIKPTRKSRSCAWLSNVSLQARARYCNTPTNAALTCPDTCIGLCNRMNSGSGK